MKPLVIEDCPTSQCWEVTGRFRQRRCECGARRFAAEGGKCGVHAVGDYNAMGEEQKAHWSSVIRAEMRATRLLDHWRAIGLRRMGWRPIAEIPVGSLVAVAKRVDYGSGVECSAFNGFSTMKGRDSWLSRNGKNSGAAESGGWEYFMALPMLPRPVNEQADELRALLAEQDQITKRLGAT